MHAHKKESVDTIKKYIVKVQHQEKNNDRIHRFVHGPSNSAVEYSLAERPAEDPARLPLTTNA